MHAGSICLHCACASGVDWALWSLVCRQGRYGVILVIGMRLLDFVLQIQEMILDYTETCIPENSSDDCSKVLAEQRGSDPYLKCSCNMTFTLDEDFHVSHQALQTRSSAQITVGATSFVTLREPSNVQKEKKNAGIPGISNR